MPALSLPCPSSITTCLSIEQVEYRIVSTSLRLALLGQVAVSRALISLLNKRPVLRDLDASGLQHLTVLWSMTTFPDNTPENKKSKDYVKDAKDGYQEWPEYVKPSDRKWDETGLRAAMAVQDKRDSGLDFQLGRVRALEAAIAVSEARGEDPIEDTDVKGVLQTIATNVTEQEQATILALSHRSWPLLMRGALASAFDGLDDLDIRAEAILKAFTHRYLGEPIVPRKRSLPELLRFLSEATAATASDGFWIEVGEDAPTSLFQPGATASDITGLETRLDTSLPEDFKAFLRTSNGFGGIWNGYHTEPALFSTSGINWISGVYAHDHLTLPGTVRASKNPETGLWYDKVPPPLCDPVLEIATEDVNSLWLIPPPVMQKAREGYKSLYDSEDAEGKKAIERAVQDFAGSWEEWEGLEWGCSAAAHGGGAEILHYKSFEEWLRSKVWDLEFGEGW